MNSSVPHTREPTGQLSPLDRQKVIESRFLVKFFTSVLSPTEALKMRDPSQCSLRSWLWATSAIAFICAGVMIVPPAALWVSSMQTIPVSAVWVAFCLIAFSMSSGFRAPYVSVSGLGTSPAIRDSPPASTL